MKWLLALIAFVALAGVAIAGADEFDNVIASEFPELVERSRDSFLTLSDMGESLTPEAHFNAAINAEAAAETAPVDTSLIQLHAAPKPAAAKPVLAAKAAAAPHKAGENARTPWHRNPSIQPVGRAGEKEIECLDGDCTRAVGVAKTIVGSHPGPHSKPPPSKLDIALSAVKEEIMVRAKELHLEKEWSKKVSALIDEYQQKLAKVSNNIVNLRTQTKALLRKKKQIQNVQVQNKLRHKLQMAQADLNRLQKQMEHIAGKENEFADTERQLKNTMHQLKNSLLKLRGQEPKKLEAEGIDL